MSRGERDRDEEAPDGLTKLRAMLADGLKAPMGDKLGSAWWRSNAGRPFEGTPDRSALEWVHGGYSATMLDSACGIAIHSQLDARRGVGRPPLG
jgi:hypothetical protein